MLLPLYPGRQGLGKLLKELDVEAKFELCGSFVFSARPQNFDDCIPFDGREKKILSASDKKNSPTKRVILGNRGCVLTIEAASYSLDFGETRVRVSINYDNKCDWAWPAESRTVTVLELRQLLGLDKPSIMKRLLHDFHLTP